MKYPKHSIIITLLSFMVAVQGLVSCMGTEYVDSVQIGIGSNDEDVPEIELDFSVPMPLDLEDSELFDPGSVTEYMVYRVRLYFFDSKTKELRTVREYHFDESDLTDPDENGVVHYIAHDKNRVFKTGTYEILAVANYNDDGDDILDKLENIEDFADFIDGQTYNTGIITNLNKGIMMTNRISDHINVDLKVGQKVKVYIPLERVLAKIAISRTQEEYELYNGDEHYCTIFPSDYQVLNLMKDFYLFRHVADAETARLGFKQPIKWNIETNYGEIPANGYAIDPHFFEKTRELSQTGQIPDFMNRNIWDSGNVLWTAFRGSKKKAYAYIVPNTMYYSNQIANYVTALRIKAVIVPTKIFNEKGNTVRPELCSDLYYYNYKFYNSIEALMKLTGIFVPTGTDDHTLYNMGIRHYPRIDTEFHSYYYYWIKHDVDTHLHSSTMKYGIVRNNVYDLVITGVKGPGIGNMIPDRNSEIDAGFMLITSSVNSWGL